MSVFDDAVYWMKEYAEVIRTDFEEVFTDAVDKMVKKVPKYGRTYLTKTLGERGNDITISYLLGRLKQEIKEFEESGEYDEVLDMLNFVLMIGLHSKEDAK